MIKEKDQVYDKSSFKDGIFSLKQAVAGRWLVCHRNMAAALEHQVAFQSEWWKKDKKIKFHLGF